MPYELSSAEFVAFSNVERENHPTIIKVILENKETRPDGLPHLVYVSREKHPRHPHHYKAGAMNVLTRVSGVMTNAPFMLNVDCDMYAKTSRLQGPMYGGTGRFHRRKVIYGLWPEGRMEIKGRRKLTDERLEKTFGNSKEFTTTAARILSGLRGISHCPYDLLNRVEAAQQVATCSYEYGTSWGTKIGWLYGTTAEDILTGMRIHAKGWRSTYCQRDPPAFLGCVPSGGPVSLTQRKRWATGLLEVQFSKNSPFIATLTAKLQFRQCLAYMWILSRGRRSIPELGYIALPAYCIMARSHFLPKSWSPSLKSQALRACWNNLRMGRITTVTARLFGFFSVILKLLGLSKTIFEVTKKDQSTTPVEDNDKDAGRFTFDESLIFVLATTLALLHLVALVAASIGPSHVGIESRIGEVICSVWLVLCFFPFLTGLFGKGKYGIPTSTICKSAALALLFLACIITSERKSF
ncbi:Cellulose synthase-like protein H1 [Vitis vinifera]|uniref:Cellulose synthase-like protein H1 n=1 Tax=Vitis vinifera TaxID=29760 RepID=A0A438DTX2_VITVI|nr:Cellulose synthase-like protein H1 [Vitis vinifera]